MIYQIPTPAELPSLPMILDDLSNPAPSVWGPRVGITKRQAQRIAAQGFAPRPIVLTLYWVTRWGIDRVTCHEENSHRLLCARLNVAEAAAHAARRELARVLSAADFGSANEPTMDHPIIRLTGSDRRV